MIDCLSIERGKQKLLSFIQSLDSIKMLEFPNMICKTFKSKCKILGKYWILQILSHLQDWRPSHSSLVMASCQILLGLVHYYLLNHGCLKCGSARHSWKNKVLLKIRAFPGTPIEAILTGGNLAKHKWQGSLQCSFLRNAYS